jgi:hypothetical protein
MSKRECKAWTRNHPFQLIIKGGVMSLPRVRFTIRQIMVAVSAVALIMAIRIETERMSWRSLDYQLRSFDHSISAAEYDGRRVGPCRGLFELPSTVRNPSKAAYHTAMARKWAEAAKHAWFPVAPDPPEPPE